MKKKSFSIAAIKRLPKYHRYFMELTKRDIERISSNQLSKKLDISASLIRHDLNTLGCIGRQGNGYVVIDLYEKTCRVLGLKKSYNTIIIGAGNIGQAIANYTNFETFGFKLKGIFDVNPKLCNLKIKNIKVRDIDLLEEFISENSVDIAILCTPKSVAQCVCDDLVKGGIKGIWNFTQIDLKLPKEVALEDVDLSDSLLTLSHLMQQIN